MLATVKGGYLIYSQMKLNKKMKKHSQTLHNSFLWFLINRAHSLKIQKSKRNQEPSQMKLMGLTQLYSYLIHSNLE